MSRKVDADTTLLVPLSLAQKINSELSSAQSKSYCSVRSVALFLLFGAASGYLGYGGALQFWYQTDYYVKNGPGATPSWAWTIVTRYQHPEWLGGYFITASFSFLVNFINIAFFSLNDFYDILDDIKHPTWKKLWINILAIGFSAVAATVNRASSALVVTDKWTLNLIWLANIFLWYPGVRKNLEHLTLPAVTNNLSVQKRFSDAKTFLEERIDSVIKQVKELPREASSYENIGNILSANIAPLSTRAYLKYPLFLALLACYVGGCFGSYSATEKDYHWALAFISIGTNIGYGIHTSWVTANAVSSTRFECSWKNFAKIVVLAASILLALPTFASALNSYQLTLEKEADDLHKYVFQVFAAAGNIFTNSYGFFWTLNNILEKAWYWKIQKHMNALEASKKIIREEKNIQDVQTLVRLVRGKKEYKIDPSAEEVQTGDLLNTSRNTSSSDGPWMVIPQPSSSTSEDTSQDTGRSLRAEASESSDSSLLPKDIKEDTIEAQIFSARKSLFDYVFVASVLFGVAYFLDLREETFTPSLAWVKNSAALAVFFASKASDWHYGCKRNKNEGYKNGLCVSITNALFDTGAVVVGMPLVSWFFVGLMDNTYLLESTIAILGTIPILWMRTKAVDVVQYCARFACC